MPDSDLVELLEGIEYIHRAILCSDHIAPGIPQMKLHAKPLQSPHGHTMSSTADAVMQDASAKTSEKAYVAPPMTVQQEGMTIAY